jgi:hypothetical protein
VLLNGIPNAPIKHGRGLRQGDPLSPLIFFIAMDPLQKLLHLATEKGYLSKLRGRTTRLRVSMYVDDTTIFVKPTRENMLALADLLTFSARLQGSKQIFQKSTIIPIRCEGLNLHKILAGSPTEVSGFPIKYLGLSLTVKRLKQVDF